MAVAVSPMFLGLTTTLNTTAFEPLMWTSLAYAVVRAIVRDEPRFLAIAGAVAGLALEAKYAVPLFLVPLIAGVALGPARRTLVTRQMLLGTALCIAIALPSAIWQLVHGLPFLELLRADDGLPRARSGHNQYGLWGPGERDSSIVIRVGGDLAHYRQICADATVAATFGVPYAMPYERDRPIVLCRGLRGGLRSLWPQLVHID